MGTTAATALTSCPTTAPTTRQSRELELTTVKHTYLKPARYTIAVKVIAIFGNDTMTLIPITAG